MYQLLGDNGTTKEIDTIWKAPATYPNTDLQQKAIDNGINAIADGKTDLLLAAVMRFGKTHSAYEIAKHADFNNGRKGKLVLVTTAKADVRTSWRNDINHVDFVDDFIFIEFIGNRVDVSLKEPGDEYLKTEKNRL